MNWMIDVITAPDVHADRISRLNQGQMVNIDIIRQRPSESKIFRQLALEPFEIFFRLPVAR